MIGETLTNHNILRQPSSVTALSVDHQACFHMFISSWQLKEAINQFSLENVVPIAHEQTVICRQLFAGHVVGCRPMEGKKKTASNDNILQSHALNMTELSIMSNKMLRI